MRIINIPDERHSGRELMEAKPTKGPVSKGRVFFARELAHNDKGEKVLRWKLGPLAADPKYAAHRDGSVRLIEPRVRMSKKERIRQRKAERASAALHDPPITPKGATHE